MKVLIATLALFLALPASTLAQDAGAAARARFDELVADRWEAEAAHREALDALREHAFSEAPPATLLAAVENAGARCDRLDAKLLNLHVLHGFQLPEFGSLASVPASRSTELYSRAMEDLAALQREAARQFARSLPDRAPLPHAVRTRSKQR